MKIKDTLSLEEKTNLFINDTTVGIFTTLFEETDPFYSLAYNMCLGYYTVRSANKSVSPIYEQMFEYVKEILKSQNELDSYNEQEIINVVNEKMGSAIIRPKFIDKWNRVYSALMTTQYDILHGFEHNETKVGDNSDTTTYDTSVGKTGNNSDSITYNSSNEKVGNNTDTITYDTNSEDNGSTGTKEVTTINRENSSDIYGFNSVSPVGDSADTETSTETVTGNANDNTTHNVNTKTGTETKDIVIGETISKSGSDTKNITISESENKTGTDTKNFVINETINKSGRNSTGAELIEAELNMRNKEIFFDIVYADIDSIATLQIYI